MSDLNLLHALAGGALIGLAASLLLYANGKVAGISGIVGQFVSGTAGPERTWRGLFLAGLLGAGLVFGWLWPSSIEASPRGLGWLALAGVLVGAGTRLGNGCTSGHGVCGVSRLAPRSIAATLTFVATGIITVTVMRWLGGGS